MACCTLRRSPLLGLVISWMFLYFSDKKEIQATSRSPVVVMVGTENDRLQIFNYQSKEVWIVLDENGEPWFVLADLCAILELGNVPMVAQRLDRDDVSTIDTIDSMGRAVNRYGVFDTILTRMMSILWTSSTQGKAWFVSDRHFLRTSKGVHFYRHPFINIEAGSFTGHFSQFLTPI